jgi:spore maturation protein CgeB
MPAEQPAAGPASGTDLRRVLFFGKSMSRTRCSGGLVDALREHGLEVRWRNMATMRRWLGQRLAQKFVRSEFRRWQPDLVFVFFRDLPRQLLAEFAQETRTALWCEEALEDIDNTVVDYFRLADLVCMSNAARFSWLREQGLDNMLFLMSGFSPRYHHPSPPSAPQRDVAFIGGPGRKGQRAEFLARISARHDTEVFGLHWERWLRHHPDLRVRSSVRPSGYARVCATSRIVLGVNEVNDDLYYFSNRTWLTLACGGFHLTHYVPGLENVFTQGEHLCWFRNQDEAMTMLEYYLARDEERSRIAASGHALALAHHSYFHRMSRMLQVLREGLPPGGDAQLPALLPDRLAKASGRD